MLRRIDVFLDDERRHDSSGNFGDYTSRHFQEREDIAGCNIEDLDRFFFRSVAVALTVIVAYLFLLRLLGLVEQWLQWQVGRKSMFEQNIEALKDPRNVLTVETHKKEPSLTPRNYCCWGFQCTKDIWDKANTNGGTE